MVTLKIYFNCSMIWLLPGSVHSYYKVRFHKGLKEGARIAIMIGQQILPRNWKSPALEEWMVQLEEVAAYDKVSYRMVNNVNVEQIE